MSRGAGPRIGGRGMEVAGVDAATRRVIDQAFANPLEIPPVFKGWLEAYLEPLIEERILSRISAIPDFVWPVWQDYVPALAATTTNPTLGTGSSQTGRWAQLGKTIIGWGSIKFGTAGVAAGSGTYLVSLPIAVQASLNILGSAFMYDSSAGAWRAGSLQQGGGSTNAVLVIGAGPLATDALPWVWAASDELRYQFSYETT